MNKALTAAGLIVITGVLAGCMNMARTQPAAAANTDPATGQRADYLNAASVKSVDEGDSSTAVQSALVWSEKYSKAIEKLVKLQQENRDLDAKIRHQSETNIKLQQDLTQCQKELADANSMLIDMQADLDQWKKNVLGFRQEMRDAQQAQIIALRRVLKLLGGEFPSEAMAGQGRGTATAGATQ